MVMESQVKLGKSPVLPEMSFKKQAPSFSLLSLRRRLQSSALKLRKDSGAIFPRPKNTAKNKREYRTRIGHLSRKKVSVNGCADQGKCWMREYDPVD